MVGFSAAEHLTQTFLRRHEPLRRSALQADLTDKRLALNS